MAGEYRAIISQSNVNQEFKELFESQKMHIAFAQSRVGNVTSTDKYNEVLIRIFTEDKSEKSQSYLRGIKNKSLVVVYSFGGKTTFTHGEAYFKNNGELFFTS